LPHITFLRWDSRGYGTPKTGNKTIPATAATMRAPQRKKTKYKAICSNAPRSVRNHVTAHSLSANINEADRFCTKTQEQTRKNRLTIMTTTTTTITPEHATRIGGTISLRKTVSSRRSLADDGTTVAAPSIVTNQQPSQFQLLAELCEFFTEDVPSWANQRCHEASDTKAEEDRQPLSQTAASNQQESLAEAETASKTTPKLKSKRNRPSFRVFLQGRKTHAGTRCS